MKGMWKVVLPAAVLLAVSACDQSSEETTVTPAEPAAEAPAEPAPVEPMPDAAPEATPPADGMMPPADGAAPAEEMKEEAPAQ
jgi:hypothetical protein